MSKLIQTQLCSSPSRSIYILTTVDSLLFWIPAVLFFHKQPHSVSSTDFTAKHSYFFFPQNCDYKDMFYLILFYSVPLINKNKFIYISSAFSVQFLSTG